LTQEYAFIPYFPLDGLIVYMFIYTVFYSTYMAPLYSLGTITLQFEIL